MHHYDEKVSNESCLMLQTTELEFDRPDGFRLTTSAMNLTPGTIHGVLGPNGSGKSTLLQLLTGLLKPNSGKITWGGKTRRQLGARRWARKIATVSQEASALPPMTVEHYVSLGLIPAEGVFGSTTEAGYRTVDQAMRTCNVEQLADRAVSDLSGGQRQRVRIARALTQTPETLILDEPDNHLDLHAVEYLAQLLRHLADNGLSVVISLHNLDLAAHLTDEVMILHKGRTLAVGRTSKVLTPELIQHCWGVEMITVDDGSRHRYLLKY
jgi:iron complex transport system ATP-binding protein